MPKRERESSPRSDWKPDDESSPPVGLRRSSRRRKVKSEVKTEVEDNKENEEDFVSLPNKPKKSRSGSRGYSKSAKTTLTRGVKSCVKDDVVSLVFSGAPVDLEWVSKSSESLILPFLDVSHSETFKNDKCPLKATHKVKQLNDGEFYDVMLNQTNIASNNNKYYILQLLERVTTGPQLAVWFRWGRVGHINGTMLKRYDKEEDLDDAINDFSKKFFDKTKNDFAERHDFEKVNGKYDWVQRDYGDNVKDEPEADDVKCEPCDLEPTIQDLLKMICNVKMMERSVKEMKFDIQKAPLGKLSSKQIQRGLTILKKLEKSILNKEWKTTQLSSQYYTHIPHDFGFKKLPVIETLEMVEEEAELLRSLDDITVAVSLNTGEAHLHPISRVYANLDCGLELADQKEFDFVKKYMAQSHGETHNAYALELDALFRVSRHAETAHAKTGSNHHFLWHGSRLTNMASILKRGLRIAPADAPVTGYMFGKGVYFADSASKSANYCHASHEQPHGLLLLCKVALGKEKVLFDADDSLPKKLGKFNSIKAIGKNVPSENEDFDGVTVPMGKHTKFVEPDKCSLLYNEYVVYDTAQVQICYAAKGKRIIFSNLSVRLLFDQFWKLRHKVKFVYDDLW